MPGLTHWQSPRYFAYFATTATEPGILAELLAAALNQVGILWRTSPALQELEEVTLAWLADLLGLPAGLHGHLEDTASTGLVTALAAARAAAPGRRVVVCSEHTHSSTAKAARLLELELRTTPVDDVVRAAPGLSSTWTAPARSSRPSARPRRPRSTPSPSSPTGAPPRASGSTSTPRTRAARPSARSFATTSPAGSARTRSASTRTSGSSRRWTAPRSSRAGRRRCASAFSLVPEYLRVDEDVVSLSEYSVPLGRRFRALKLWAVLRCYGREGLQALIREHVRLAGLFEGWVRDEPGWEVCAPRHFSLVCFRRDGTDEENEALLERVNASGRGLPLAHAARRPLRAAARDRQRPHDRGRRARRLGRAPARGVRLERPKEGEDAVRPGDDHVRGLDEAGRRLAGVDGDPDGELEPVEPANASRSVVSSPA